MIKAHVTSCLGQHPGSHAPPPSCTHASRPSANCTAQAVNALARLHTVPGAPHSLLGSLSTPALFNCPPNSSQRGLCKQTGCIAQTQALPCLLTHHGASSCPHMDPQARPDRPVSSVVSPTSLPQLSPHQPTAPLLSSHSERTQTAPPATCSWPGCPKAHRARSLAPQSLLKPPSSQQSLRPPVLTRQPSLLTFSP